MSEKEKLDLLIDGFGKLDKSRKEYIQGLIRKLVEIHYGGEFSGESRENDLGQSEISGVYPA